MARSSRLDYGEYVDKSLLERELERSVPKIEQYIPFLTNRVIEMNLPNNVDIHPFNRLYAKKKKETTIPYIRHYTPLSREVYEKLIRDNAGKPDYRRTETEQRSSSDSSIRFGTNVMRSKFDSSKEPYDTELMLDQRGGGFTSPSEITERRTENGGVQGRESDPFKSQTAHPMPGYQSIDPETLKLTVLKTLNEDPMNPHQQVNINPAEESMIEKTQTYYHHPLSPMHDSQVPTPLDNGKTNPDQRQDNNDPRTAQLSQSSVSVDKNIDPLRKNLVPLKSFESFMVQQTGAVTISPGQGPPTPREPLRLKSSAERLPKPKQTADVALDTQKSLVHLGVEKLPSNTFVPPRARNKEMIDESVSPMVSAVQLQPSKPKVVIDLRKLAAQSTQISKDTKAIQVSQNFMRDTISDKPNDDSLHMRSVEQSILDDINEQMKILQNNLITDIAKMDTPKNYP